MVIDGGRRGGRPVGLDPYGKLAVENRTLKMEIDRLRLVIEACDAYHGKVRQAFSDASRIAMRHATADERAELEELRRRVL